MSSRKLNRLKQ